MSAPSKPPPMPGDGGQPASLVVGEVGPVERGDGESLPGPAEAASEAPPEAPPEESEGSAGSEEEAPQSEADKRRRVIRSVIEWTAVIGGALLVALLVKTFLIQAFWIPSPSMNPTLVNGDRVLVNKLADDLGDLNRGDIIVFERPEENGNGEHPESEINDLIKRVIGLPGDTLEAENGRVFVNGERLDEPYLEPDEATGNLPPTEVPANTVFVMGDNRDNSHDSRRFGPVPEDNIVGRAFFRVWPLSDIGRL